MPRAPSLFVSHGAPTFATEPGQAGPKLTALGRALPRPEAVLVVSPHWMTATPRVGLAVQPQTIHDFGGFDPALYRVEYPARGHPLLARRTIETLNAAGWSAQADERRGLDHGAWVPLRHLYPNANIPVFQVSLPARLDADSAWAFGAALAPLAEDGVLIVGSGSLTHNLADFRGRHGEDHPYVPEFTAWVREVVRAGDGPALRRTLASAPHAARAHPTPEHFWPLLVAAGAAPAKRTWRMVDGGVAHGMLAMDAVVFGADDATAPRVHLDMQTRTARLLEDGGTTVALPVGPDTLAEDVLRHDPPTPYELERAIDVVEDALRQWRDARPEGGVLVTTDSRLRMLPGLEHDEAVLGRDAVERLFQRLASQTLAIPDIDPSRSCEVAAALLIVRECLHHLGLERVEIAVA